MRLVAALTLVVSSTFAQAAEQSAFTASAGVGFLNRSFTWAGAPSSTLTPASQPFAGAVAVDASWFPGAHVTEGPGSWFGLFGQADVGLGLASKLANVDAVFAQTATRLRLGGIVRFPLGERAWLIVHGGSARQGFSTSSKAVSGTATRPTAPDILFEGPRGGLGTRVKLGGTAELDVTLGAQYVTGFGELGSSAWFPNASAFAADASLGLSFGLLEHVRLRFSGQWQGTFVTLNSSGTFRDETAFEQYVTGALTLQWAM